MIILSKDSVCSKAKGKVIITHKPIIIGKIAVLGIKSKFFTIVKVDKVYVLS